MPRKPRHCIPGDYFHIIIRGNNRTRIFFSTEDRAYFLSLIHEGVKRYNHKIHAFCLMSNHVHLAIEVDQISISKIMHNINFRYARWVNLQQKKVGHVFQARYKAILIDSKRYLLELVRYIHLNPVRAKIVNFINNYKWSSHQAYIGKQSMPWLTTEFVLGLLGAGELNAIKYEEYMSITTMPEVEKILLYGDEIPLEDSLSYKKNIHISIEPLCDFEKIVTVICCYYGISKEALVSLSRQRIHSLARGMVAYLSKELRVVTLTDCARYLNRDMSGLIRIVNKYETDEKMKDLMGTLKLKITQ